METEWYSVSQPEPEDLIRYAIQDKHIPAFFDEGVIPVVGQNLVLVVTNVHRNQCGELVFVCKFKVQSS